MIPLPALISKPVLIAAAVALVAVGAVAVMQTLRLGAEQVSHANSRASFDKAAREQAEGEARTIAAYRRQEAVWQGYVNERSAHARKQLESAKVDLAAAADAGGRLREREAQLAACDARAAAPTVAASGSAPARTTADLLADVRRRLDAATDGIAGHADASRIAGLACEQSYEAVK